MKLESEVNCINFKNVFIFLINSIQNLTIFEKSQSDNDYLLQGFLNLIGKLIENNKNFKFQLLDNKKFIKEILHSCLFEMPTGNFKIKSLNFLKILYLFFFIYLLKNIKIITNEKV